MGTSSIPTVRCSSSSMARRRRGRGRRRVSWTCWRGAGWPMAAAMAQPWRRRRSVRRGRVGSGGEWERRRNQGESGGEWEAGSRKRGRGGLILPGVGAGEVVGRECAPVPTRVGGTGKGGGRGRRAGPAGPVGWLAISWAVWSKRGGSFPFVLFSFFSFYLFSFLF